MSGDSKPQRLSKLHAMAALGGSKVPETVSEAVSAFQHEGSASKKASTESSSVASHRKRRRSVGGDANTAELGSGFSTAGPNVGSGENVSLKRNDVDQASQRSKRSKVTSFSANRSGSTKERAPGNKPSPSRTSGSSSTAPVLLDSHAAGVEALGGSTRARRMVQLAQAIPLREIAPSSMAALQPRASARTRGVTTGGAGQGAGSASASAPLIPVPAATASPGRSARLMPPPPPAVTPAGTGRSSAIVRPGSAVSRAVGSSRAQRALAAAQAQTVQSGAGKGAGGMRAPGTEPARSTPSRPSRSTSDPSSSTPMHGALVAKVLRLDTEGGARSKGEGSALGSGTVTPAAVDRPDDGDDGDANDDDSPSSPRHPSLLGAGLGGGLAAPGAGPGSSDTSFSVPLSQHIREGVGDGEDEDTDAMDVMPRPEPLPHLASLGPGGTVDAGGMSGRSEAAGASLVDLVAHNDPTTLVSPEQQLIHAANCAGGSSLEECRRVLRAWSCLSVPSARKELLYYACQHAASSPCEDGMWAGKASVSSPNGAGSSSSLGSQGVGTASTLHPEDDCYLFILMDGHGGVEMMNFGLSRLPSLVQKHTGHEGTVAGIVHGLKTAFAECDKAFLQDCIAPLYAAERAAHAEWKAANEPSSGPLKLKYDKARYALHLKGLAGSCTQVVLFRKASLTQEGCSPAATGARRWMVFTASAGDVRAVLGTSAQTPVATPAAASLSSAGTSVQRPAEEVLLSQLHREEHGLDSPDGLWKDLQAHFVDSKSRSRLCPPAVQQWPDACGVPELLSLGPSRKVGKEASSKGAARFKAGTESAGGSLLSPGIQRAVTHRAEELSSSGASPPDSVRLQLTEEELEEIDGNGRVLEAKTIALSGSTLAEGLSVFAVVEASRPGAASAVTPGASPPPSTPQGSTIGAGGATSSSWASKGATKLPLETAGQAGVDTKSLRILPPSLMRAATHTRALALVEAGRVLREMGLTRLMRGAFPALSRACRLTREISGVSALSEDHRRSVYLTLELVRARRAALVASGLMALPMTIDHTPLHPQEYRAVVDRAAEPVPIRRMRKGPLSADMADRDKIAGDMPYQVKGEELRDEGLRQWKSEKTREGQYVPTSFAANPLRVAGSLAVTRALGDWYLKVKGLSFEAIEEQGVPYITPEPDVTWRVVQPGDSFLVMACDGVWDVLRPAVAVELVAAALADDALVAGSGLGPAKQQDRAGTIGASTSDGERAGTLVGRSSSEPASSPSDVDASLRNDAFQSGAGSPDPSLSSIRAALQSGVVGSGSGTAVQPLARTVCAIRPTWTAACAADASGSSQPPATEPAAAASTAPAGVGAGTAPYSPAAPYIDISVLSQVSDVTLGTPAQRLVGTAVLAYQMLQSSSDGAAAQDKQSGPRRYWETAHTDLSKRYEELLSLLPKPAGPPQLGAPPNGYRRQKHDDTSAVVVVLPDFMARENAEAQGWHQGPVGFPSAEGNGHPVVEGLDAAIHPAFLQRWGAAPGSAQAAPALVPHYQPFDFTSFIQGADAVLGGQAISS